MSKLFTEEDNLVLDRIIEERRTVRHYKDELPPKESIEAIVDAGMRAPYASLGVVGVENFRRFYIIPKGNLMIAKVDALIRSRSALDAKQLEEDMEKNPLIRENGKLVHELWTSVAEKGIPGFLDSPYLIIVAEWRGARRAEKQTLAHVMQNMWLKATALNLGFKLVSPIESMTDNAEFCALFGNSVGDFGYHGCIVGYAPDNGRTPASRPVSGTITWL
jgi:nitroreductase